MSKREAVAQALLALVERANIFADVHRNRDRPTRIPPGGQAILRDGDPGEPSVDLGVLSYNYTHRFPLEVAVSVDDPEDRSLRLDNYLMALGQTVAADRTLGGLCEWLDIEAPAIDDAQDAGSGPVCWADLALVAEYASPTPLT
jgi:hypothetical protein